MMRFDLNDLKLVIWEGASVRISLRTLLLAAFVVLLVNACASTEILPMPTLPPTSAPSTSAPMLPTAMLEPTAMPTFVPTPTVTPVPTPDPAVALDAVISGFVDVHARTGDATLLCARYEDTDADGEPEWLVLVHQEAMPPRLNAFIFDGDATFELEPGPAKPGNPGGRTWSVFDLRSRSA